MSGMAHWAGVLRRDAEFKDAMKSLLFSAAAWSGLGALIAVRLGISGVILLFHEVQPPDPTTLNRAATVPLLDFALRWLNREGWKVVELDEALGRLEDPDPSCRFAVLTFDDGYRDLVSYALPVLAAHRAPFTVYIPTGALTKTLYCWWLGLRELFRKADSVAIEAMGRRFECPTIADKRKAIAEIEDWVSADYQRAALLSSTFASACISLEQLNSKYFLDEHELQILSRHPLATIGAHTTSHPALATLDHETARREMEDNRAYLRNLIQRPVCHFANPHGGPAACGVREADLAAQLGFCSAVTTRHGHVLTGQRVNRFMLPRVGFNRNDTPASVVSQLCGVKSAVLRVFESANRKPAGRWS